MAITRENIKLLKSERMTDAPDGGGHITGNVIADGLSNSIFPDINETDRAYGRVNLRKCYAAVLSALDETYGGAYVYVEKPPEDSSVSVTLFGTDSWSDERSDAVKRVEAYLARGPRFAAYLYDQHIAGQAALAMLARTSTPVPGVGDTIVVVKNPGLITEVEQYLRITSFSSTAQEFEDSQGKFTRAVWTVGVSDPLDFDVGGGQPSRYDDTQQSFASRVHKTVVADAARYAGIQPLALAATTGALTIRAASMFSQLVPSAQTEIPVVDTSPYGTMETPITAGGAVSFSTSQAFGPTNALYFGMGAHPGSLAITAGAVTLTEKGGLLMQGETEVGTVDLANGIARINASGPSYSGTKTVTFTGCAFAPRDVRTLRYEFTPATRTSTITGFLNPVPKAGTTRFSYRAQGKWYVLTDDGTGALRGEDPSHGSGVVNLSTGSVIVTMGALPDVPSAGIFTFSSPSVDLVKTGRAVKFSARLQCADALKPNAVTVTWNDGAPRTATDNGSGGLTGDATGVVNYGAGTIDLAPNVLPAAGTVFTVARTLDGVRKTATLQVAFEADSETMIVDLPDANVMPGRIDVAWVLPAPIWNTEIFFAAITGFRGERVARAQDNGSGALLGVAGSNVNYATGRITFKPKLLSVPSKTYSKTASVGGALGPARTEVSTYTVGDGTPWMQDVAGTPKTAITVTYSVAQAESAGTETFTPTGYTFDAVGEHSISLVPGALRFTLGSSTLVERSGALRRDVSTVTGIGTACGAVNMETGVCTLTDWPASIANSGTVSHCVLAYGSAPVNQITVRTPAAPVRPGSFSFRCRFVDATADTIVTVPSSGVISAADVKGTLDHDTGIADIRFGSLVVAAGNEAQPWYHADNVDGDGNIWKPRNIVADSFKFNATSYAYIPLDAGLLGINPVRLPTDGRVPVFRPGDLALVHHTATVSGTYSNGQTVNLGRVRVSRVRCRDAAGVLIDEARYTTNLDLGTLTWTNVATLAQPITIEHTIYDMGLLSDVQINGSLTMTRQLTHDYPLGSFVSSLLFAGDLWGRYTNLFEQQAWTGAWSDDLIGSAPVASYNDTTYPLIITNDGAVTERWLIKFTNSSQVDVIGETVGVIASGLSITNDIAPINPNTGKPYFLLDNDGWGGGWVSGNVLRFNTFGAGYPLWIARTIKQGLPTHPNDSFALNVVGGIDA